MTNFPLVSVVMPCFNAESFVAEAIQSIVAQTFEQWELIAIDDASTDQTLGIVRSFNDPRISVIELAENRGYPVAMNVGIAVAKGHFIARMDADDISMPSRLEEQLNAMQKFPNASMCGVNRFRITPGGKYYTDRVRFQDPFTFETWEDLMNNERIFTDASVLIEKKKLLLVGGYRDFQRSGMDVDLWFRVMEKYGPCLTLTNTLFGRRLAPRSLIFKPETSLINQVPRVLARQRKMFGMDDVMSGLGVNMESYLKQGLIRQVGGSESRALMIGAAATCFSFGDRKGFWIYFNQAWRFDSGMFQKALMVFGLLKKMIGRLWYNPYQRIK